MASKKKVLLSLTLPLFVHTTKAKTKKGKAIMNLNNYRNWHHTKSNGAKRAMKDTVKKLIGKQSLGVGPFKLVYTYYHGNKRKLDVANPCSIIDKFVCDALTELKCWPDDNVDYVHEVVFKWGGVDPNKVGYCKLDIHQC